MTVKSLNSKQQAFVEHYIACGWNATEAARRAGYSAKTAGSIGHENLTKPEIRAAINARVAELKMSADEVLTRLADMARSNMGDFIKLVPAADGKGKVAVFDFDRAAKAGKLHLIKSIKINAKGTIVELHDAQAALVQLGRHHGLFADRLEIVDWREEARKAGLQPEQLVTSFEQALLTGKVETDAGDAAE